MSIVKTSHQRQKLLFYLPVVTPWWFDNIVVHLIRSAAIEHEIHVLVPPLWRNTGIGPEQLQNAADLQDVLWYVLDGPSHHLLRTDASDQQDLISLVSNIDPDIVLCRSADMVTVKEFPGTIRFIMEAGIPPLKTDNTLIQIVPALFDHGILPDLTYEQLERLSFIGNLLFEEMDSQMSIPPRAEFFRKSRLPTDKFIIGLALEYEHEENFFAKHRPFSNNADVIEKIASQLGDEFFLAVTNHPLNDLYVDNTDIYEAAAAYSDKVSVLRSQGKEGDLTLALAAHCDGLIVSNSKAWSAGAALGTPILRLSGFSTGEWVNAYLELSMFLEDIVSRRSKYPDPIAARRWFAFHIANNAFDARDASIAINCTVARSSLLVAEERWDFSVSRHLSNID